MDHFINYIATLSPLLSYTLLFFGFAFESNSVLFISAFLAQQGAFSLPGLIIIGYIGSVAGDAMFYAIGLLDLKYLKWYQKLANGLARPFDHHLTRTPARTIVLSKFIYALNCAISIRAGQLRLPFIKFMLIDAVACLPWLFIIGALGYGSGSFFNITAQDVAHTEIALLIIIGGFIFIKYYVSAYLRKKIADKPEEV